MEKKQNGCDCVSNSCCKVEAMVSVDERGQMVLPKELREKADIRPGDKLAVVSWERDGKVCCIALLKSEELVKMVKDVLGPLMKDVLS
ncbi:MAG: AbrB/MazE/SpoVT family DNA-binding domain-containing protein [Chloroflexi bacterium]|nr:AbrB/MazE/SpoVT family DNA-binding domain-containing protein [Chloroflexota bacterium]